MSANAAKLYRSGRFRLHRQFGPTILAPATPGEIRDCLTPGSRYQPPFRPMGAGSSSTDCASSPAGTVIDMTRLAEIRHIDAYADTVTVQAGVRIGALAKALAKQGLELAGSHDLMSRTVGGAVAGCCIGPSIGDDGAFFASQVLSVKLITPNGRPIQIRRDQKNLLNAFRLSYGMLGIIYEVTLKVRPIRPFAASHRRCTIEQFAAATEKLSTVDVGAKFYVMPFRNRVYLDLRQYSSEQCSTHKLSWRIKDWGESTVMPHVFKSLNKVVPISGVRYRIIDEISQLTQGIVNNRMVSSGSNATAQFSRDDDAPSRLHYSTWFFPATDFAIVIQAYRDLCHQVRNLTGFRCDMPAVGFRLPRDRSAMLSPSFEEPMFALRAISTEKKGWEDFAIDFADFAQHWGGLPVFNQSRNVEADYARQAFGSCHDFFRKIRRQFDPENRMMNPFLSQYFL